jgi:hypothetical protein
MDIHLTIRFFPRGRQVHALHDQPFDYFELRIGQVFQSIKCVLTTSTRMLKQLLCGGFRSPLFSTTNDR